MITYNSKGVVLGNYWGGGKGSYAAQRFSSSVSKEDLIEINKKALEDGSLDSGMGYESLIGALIYIETVTRILHENKPFTNTEVESIFIGDLTDAQKDFLSDIYDN